MNTPRNTGRRRFLSTAGSLAALGLATPLRALFGAEARADDGDGYGPLVKDPDGLLDLPAGFRYSVLSRTGERMSDGYLVPGAHDGMAAFRAPNGNTLLVRNHELAAYSVKLSPFREQDRRPDDLYDPTCIAGTTTLEVDRDGRLVRHFLSLAGTSRNCAGGPTPWGTWVSCEETVVTAGTADAPDRKPGQPRDPGVVVQRTHGYNFEVPAAATGPVRPRPLVEMGRFNHAAVAVDPHTGYVYQTEDRPDGILYRFRPNVPGDLAQGGELEALRILAPGFAAADTSNRPGARVRVERGRRYPVAWEPIREPDPASDTLRYEARMNGANPFARGEGIYYSRGSVFFACTSGGPEGRGQIWRLHPSRNPSVPDMLELFVEVGKDAPLQRPDNLCAAPNGDLVICEDGDGEQHVVGATRRGRLYRLARNAQNDSEFAGATFSPDGRILFVNVQKPGMTFAITGPWRR